MAGVMLQNVVKKYGDTPVIEKLNLDIQDHEFMVLVGPSGCGKSTALRMIAGLEEISEGQILIGDRVVNDLPPKDRDIAMVFQSYALYPHMTVKENLEFGLKIQKGPREQIDRRVRREPARRTDSPRARAFAAAIRSCSAMRTRRRPRQSSSAASPRTPRSPR